MRADAEQRVSIPDRVVRWCVCSAWAPLAFAAVWYVTVAFVHPAPPAWQTWLVGGACGFSFWGRARRRWGT